MLCIVYYVTVQSPCVPAQGKWPSSGVWTQAFSGKGPRLSSPRAARPWCARPNEPDAAALVCPWPTRVMLKHVCCSQSALESRCLFHAAAQCRVLLVAAHAMWPLSGGARMICGPRSGLGMCVEWAVCERGMHVRRMRVQREAAPSAVARACESCCCDL